MWHTNYLLKPVTIDGAKPRDKAYALLLMMSRKSELL
jgi:hypothetical protein